MNAFTYNCYSMVILTDNDATFCERDDGNIDAKNARTA
jgi:hypothetical protein